MSRATSAGERSRCYSHVVVHCRTWCVFMEEKKKQFVTEPSQESIEGCWTEGLFRMEEICSGHSAQPPSQSFWFASCCSAMVIWPLLSYHPFTDLRIWGAELIDFFLFLSFLFPTKRVWLGSPPFSAHISLLHPTPVWVAGRIWLSVSWMHNWIGSSSKSHHPTAAMSF